MVVVAPYLPIRKSVEIGPWTLEPATEAVRSRRVRKDIQLKELLQAYDCFGKHAGAVARLGPAQPASAKLPVCWFAPGDTRARLARRLAPSGLPEARNRLFKRNRPRPPRVSKTVTGPSVPFPPMFPRVCMIEAVVAMTGDYGDPALADGNPSHAPATPLPQRSTAIAAALSRRRAEAAPACGDAQPG